MEWQPMLILREKSPLPENSPQRRIEPTTVHQAGKRAQHTTNKLFWPLDTLYLRQESYLLRQESYLLSPTSQHYWLQAPNTASPELGQRVKCFWDHWTQPPARQPPRYRTSLLSSELSRTPSWKSGANPFLLCPLSCLASCQQRTSGFSFLFGETRFPYWCRKHHVSNSNMVRILQRTQKSQRMMEFDYRKKKVRENLM